VAGRLLVLYEFSAAATYKIIHRRFTDEERKGIFGPEITVPTERLGPDTLHSDTGRNPSRGRDPRPDSSQPRAAPRLW